MTPIIVTTATIGVRDNAPTQNVNIAKIAQKNHRRKKMKDLGKRIKLARVSKDLTQEQLALLIGMKQKAISRYEREECAPSLKTLIKIIKALDISGTDLL